MSEICPKLDCFLPDDLASCPSIFAAGPISLLVQCPQNYFCPPGMFPRVVTYQVADLPAVVACNFSDNSPILLALQGCQSIISRTLPAGSSQAVINAAAQGMIGEFAGQQSICDSIADLGLRPLPFTNDEQVFLCNNGSNPTPSAAYQSNPPSTIAGQGVRLIVNNQRDATVLGADFKLFFDAVLITTGAINVPGHTSLQEFDTVAGSPLHTWFITYQGVIFAQGLDLNFKYVVTINMLNPFTGGGGVVVSNNRIVVPAGTFAGATKAEANATALAALNRIVAASMADGSLTCA